MSSHFELCCQLQFTFLHFLFSTCHDLSNYLPTISHPEPSQMPRFVKNPTTVTTARYNDCAGSTIRLP